ncbi:MAG: hypothetical protein ACI9YB_000549, partial [Halioglobus sp.]
SFRLRRPTEGLAMLLNRIEFVILRPEYPLPVALHLTVTQLLSAARLQHFLKRTLTSLIVYHHKRTVALSALKYLNLFLS